MTEHENIEYMFIHRTLTLTDPLNQYKVPCMQRKCPVAYPCCVSNGDYCLDIVYYIFFFVYKAETCGKIDQSTNKTRAAYQEKKLQQS